MRCLLLPLMMLSSSTAFVAPVAPARPQHVVRAEKEGEAVAKKKGIPLALLIWPLIAVGDDDAVEWSMLSAEAREADADDHLYCSRCVAASA